MEPCDASTLARSPSMYGSFDEEGSVVSRNCASGSCPGRSNELNRKVFECHSLQRSSSRPASFMGMSITQTRCLERREPYRRGSDRPWYVPARLPIETVPSTIPRQDAWHRDVHARREI
jgi:hypothetical protein